MTGGDSTAMEFVFLSNEKRQKEHEQIPFIFV